MVTTPQLKSLTTYISFHSAPAVSSMNMIDAIVTDDDLHQPIKDICDLLHVDYEFFDCTEALAALDFLYRVGLSLEAGKSVFVFSPQASFHKSIESTFDTFRDTNEFVIEDPEVNSKPIVFSVNPQSHLYLVFNKLGEPKTYQQLYSKTDHLLDIRSIS